MLEGTTRFKPDALLGVFIGKEEAILCRRAQPLDLGQLLSEGRRCVHHRRLGEEKIYDDASFWSMADKIYCGDSQILWKSSRASINQF